MHLCGTMRNAARETRSERYLNSHLLAIANASTVWFCASLGVVFASQTVIAETSSAQDDGQPPEAAAAPVPTPLIMEYRFLPHFTLHISLEPTVVKEMAGALGLDPEQERDVRAVLVDSIQQLDRLEEAGHERLKKAGMDQGDALWKQWFETYGAVTHETDRELFEEGQVAKAEMDAALAELSERIQLEAKQVMIQAEGVIDTTVQRLADLSPLPEEESLLQARLTILRQALMRHGPDVPIGDFSRLVDVRDFIQFASKCDQDIAACFGLKDDPQGFANPADELGDILREYDNAQLAYLDGRLASRRKMYGVEGSVPPREVAQAWSKGWDLPRSTSDRIASVLDEKSAELGARWRSLFQEYFCPQLTGLWPADTIIEFVTEVEVPTMPADKETAVREIASQYEQERRRLVNEAFSLGVAAKRKHGSTHGSRGGEPEPAQAAYLHKLSELRALSTRTVDAIVTLIGSDPTLESISHELDRLKQQLINSGNGPFIRPHLGQHAGVRQ
jgi:hypothetical protein